MTPRNKLLMMLALVLLLLIPSTGTLAKNDPVYINPQFEDEITVSSTDEVIIEWPWFACSKGLVNDFIDSADIDLFINEVMVEKADKQSWDTPTKTPVEEDIFAEHCVWDVDTSWTVNWEYGLGKLEPGSYRINTIVDFSFPVIDGIDVFEPIGEVDVYNETFDHEMILHVTP